MAASFTLKQGRGLFSYNIFGKKLLLLLSLFLYVQPFAPMETILITFQ